MSLPLVVTPGDPRGIGPEVTVKALQQIGERALVIGDAAAVQRWGDVDVLEPPKGEPVEVASLRLAVQMCLDGRAAGLVTGPIHKARLAEQGFEHPGHTTFLGKLTGARPVMGFVGGRFRVVLATVHVPLSQVSDARASGPHAGGRGPVHSCLGGSTPAPGLWPQPPCRGRWAPWARGDRAHRPSL